MHENTTTYSGTGTGNICTHCGLCCDGSLFGKVMIHSRSINACFIQALKQSGEIDDLSFRKTHSKQILDCLILEELLKRKFYKEDGKMAKLIEC